MSHRVLITGASGYLGGTLMARLAASRADLPPFETLFASVRNDAQAESVRSLYGAEPLSVDFRDARAVRDAVVGHRITVVFYLIDAIGTDGQLHLIRALAEVKKATGLPVHFLHTTGAKLFSSHAGAPTDRPLLDTDPDLYDIQRAQKARFPLAQKGVEANCKIIDAAEELGVRSYIFAPCIVYGKNEGFGNPVSIQTVAIVRAAKAAGRVYRVDEGRPTWPVCHVVDNATLYVAILRQILAGADDRLGHGRKGYYLAASGSVAWDDLYAAMAVALQKRGVVRDATVAAADEEALERMAAGLGCPKELVALQLGGKCTFTAAHGKAIGWAPQFPAQHILEAADEEVDRILRNL